MSAETKSETRERLLAAAAQEFGRAGLERASIDAISLRAGVAKGTIYNYFSSKEDVFLAVVDEAARRAASAADDGRATTVRERLELTLAGFCDWARDHEAFARVLVRECLMGTPDLYSKVMIAETPLVHALESLVIEGVRGGEIRDDVPPAVLALALAGLVDLGLAQYWASDGARPTLEEIPGLAVQLLLGAPGKPPRPGRGAR